ncbi:MAG TPA: acyltransferase [Pyrinomonadaceae bacterium]|jgi:peptidoglycan/LPS O-acetylase OafA/YrhL|nr:acyltransferase [Pyrinomonadaceae bacterium]
MKLSKTYPSGGGRLQSIDALRGIAALGVVFYHAVWQTSSAAPANLFHWPVKLLQLTSSFGYIGVFLFFVISGFCIHLQWARSQAQGQPQSIQFGAFWRRRFRRLYPPYLIAFALFILLAAATTGIHFTHFFVYDVVMHLLMLHNLDPNTCYSINGVFWTLAIEEQLYLAYFLLLFLRRRWGWGRTLLICAGARVGWYFVSHAFWVAKGIGVPVPEAAASHWFTWALGAIAVEAAFGLVKLPKWCSNLWLGVAAIVLASATSTILPQTQKDTLPHDLAWLLMHPLWGFGFFVVVNRAVQAEQAWANKGSLRNATFRFSFASLAPKLVAAVAFVGVFSYSLYLTHELVIIQSWRIVSTSLPPVLNTFLIVIPATVGFAWLFYLFCEKPYMRSRSQKTFRSQNSEPSGRLSELSSQPTLNAATDLLLTPDS